MNKNLSICEICGEPATYGDGVTWARCSKHERIWQEEHGVKDPESPKGTDNEKVEHKLIEGLTSIIMPVYMVSYTLFHYTGNAIGSIREHTDRSKYELIVVDNGSPIKPPNLQSYYADKVITNESNLGVTKAWNQGIRASFGEYICLMNNDVQVFDNWLEDMKKGLETYDLVMAHPMYSLTEPFARATEAKEGTTDPIHKRFDDIPGGKDFSCVMMKKSLLQEVGVFDEDFFNYCSDIEFLDRLKAAGKTFSIVPVYVHHVSDATGFSVAETPDIMNKDKEIYAKKQEESRDSASTPHADVVNTAIPESPLTPREGKVSNLMRSPATGDKIFLVVDGKTHWVKSPEVLIALGFDFGQEGMMTREDFSKLIKGEDLTMENVEKYKNA